MRRLVVIAIRVGSVLAITLLILMVYLAFERARARSGPSPQSTIRIHLGMITEAKEALRKSGHLADDYWPARAEIAAAHAGKSGYSFEALFKRSTWGEVYIVNQIGAPAYAYLSNAAGGFPEGCLLTLQNLDPEHNQPVQRTEASRSADETNQTSDATGSRR